MSQSVALVFDDESVTLDSLAASLISHFPIWHGTPEIAPGRFSQSGPIILILDKHEHSLVQISMVPPVPELSYRRPAGQKMFSIRYRPSPETIQCLNEVLLILADQPTARILLDDEPFEYTGKEFVEHLRKQPDWKWLS